jgi:hypothetical protein
MITVMVAGTVITNRTQALALAARLNHYAADSHSIEGSLAIDMMQEKLVTAGLLTWDDVDKAW